MGRLDAGDLPTGAADSHAGAEAVSQAQLEADSMNQERSALAAPEDVLKPCPGNQLPWAIPDQAVTDAMGAAIEELANLIERRVAALACCHSMMVPPSEHVVN